MEYGPGHANDVCFAQIVGSRNEVIHVDFDETLEGGGVIGGVR